MSYVAIARKYRPSTFAEIVGQDHVTKTLTNAIASDRVHHAYLFCGARGVGKTTAARALSRSLNCEQGPTSTPCGECTSCVEISGGRSPDLIEIDGASNNSVEDIRELRESVRYGATHGRRKIYLIDEVHMLSKGAFNALLKTLEEPPPHIVFIFATTEPQKIPDTILSRVQRFDFKRIHVDAVTNHLASISKNEGVTISTDALRLLARAGEGSMRDSQSLLDQVFSAVNGEVSVEDVVEAIGLVDRGLLYSTLEGMVTGDPGQVLEAIEKVYNYGYDLSQFTSDMLELLRNATFARMSESTRAHLDIPADELAQLDDLTNGVPHELLTRLFSAMLDIHDQVSHAARPRIILEMAVARLTSLRAAIPVPDLLEKLNSLERQARHQQPRSTRRPRQTETTRPAVPTQAPPPRKTPPPPNAPAQKSQTKSTPKPAAQKSPPPAPEENKAAHGDDSPVTILKQRLAALGGVAKKFSSSEFSFDGSELTITVDSARSVAAIKRLNNNDDVIGLLSELFGDGALIQTKLVDLQRKKAEVSPLFQQVMDDAPTQRIAKTLDATITDATLIKGEK